MDAPTGGREAGGDDGVQPYYALCVPKTLSTLCDRRYSLMRQPV